MCQYCWGECDLGGGVGMSLLPLVTRLRKFYKRAWSKTAGSRSGCPSGISSPVTSNNLTNPAKDPPVTSATSPLSNPSSGSLGRAPLELRKDGVRVLLFRECDTRGRKLLYDSKTVIQVPLGDAAPHSAPQPPKALFKGSWGGGGSGQHAPKSPTSARAQQKSEFAEVSGGFGYQYQQKESDTKTFAELVFGSVDLAYRGSCSKLHLLQEPPPRVLLSRTAPAPPSHLPRLNPASDPGIEDGSFSSSISSLGDNTVGCLEVPWGAGGPTLAMGVPGLGSSHSEGDSGFGGPPSPYSSTCGSFLSPPSLASTPHGTPSSRQGSGSSLKNSGSLNSLQRRFLRNVNTSLEFLGAGQEEGRSTSPAHPGQRRATKLGLAVIVELKGQQQESVEEWLFLHLGVIESCVNKLQSALHSAYQHRQTFVSATHAAVTKLQQDLVDLVSGPRLCRPVWLGLLGQPGAAAAAAAERQALCTSFVNTLSGVLATFDTKHTNFFVSKLLTAVLTHHLGWVSTVAPHDPPMAASPPASPVITHQLPPFTPAQPSWAERLSESHPYSAVWAQLCELSGAVGYPPRAARTVLLGSDTSLLQHLLLILSYVIRCSQVVEQRVEAPQGSPEVAPAVPRHLQPGPSQCSSAASIATIVEEVAGPLQREASLRHRRATRGGARSQELRGTAGTLDGADEQPRLAVEKDGGESGRWMLNDGEEIVIHTGEGGRPPSPCPPPRVEPPPKAPEPHLQLEAAPDRPARTLKSSKTSSDLSSLIGAEDDAGGPYLTPALPPVVAPPHAPGSLYPALHHLDDHRETFGDVELEPVKIAEKVHKLFRGSPLREPDPRKAAESPVPNPRTPQTTTQTPVPPPRTRRSISLKGDLDARKPECGARKVWPTRVTVPAKDIHPEVEEGGGVLLLPQNTPPTHTPLHAHSDAHVNSPRIAPTHTQSDTHVHKRTQPSPGKQTRSDTHIHTHGIGFEGLVVNGGPVTCLPHPTDTRRKVRSRNVGRVSAFDLTKLEAEKAIYPTLSDLKEDVGSSERSKPGHVGSQTHRRHHSDPTNGLFTSIPVLSLNSVDELQERTQPQPQPENSVEAGAVCRKGLDAVAVCGGAVECVDAKESNGTAGLVEQRPGGAEEEEEEEETGAKEEPVLIGMPRCVCTTTTTTNTTSTNGLAGSLLGGVLDHYASPFVLHATTETQRWEDALRQDLSSAAHHSPLDPQLAEAVAVVADTDSWEVQVVSSHSYVVAGSSGVCGGGGSGLVGVRVDASPLVSSITDSVLDLARLGTAPLFVVQHLEERLSELYLRSQLLAQYLLGGVGGGGASSAPYHLPELTRALGLDLNDLPLLLAVASTHTPALTHMFGLSVR